MALFKGKIVKTLAVYNAEDFESPNDPACHQYGETDVAGAALGHLADMQSILSGALMALGYEGRLELCFQVEGSEEWQAEPKGFWHSHWVSE